MQEGVCERHWPCAHDASRVLLSVHQWLFRTIFIVSRMPVSRYITIETCTLANAYARCMIDCYYRSGRDRASVSRESRIVELDCESHSIAISDELIFNSKTVFVANTTFGASRSSTSLESNHGASVGATASANVEETAAWTDRASATGQVQTGTAPELSVRCVPSLCTLITIALIWSNFFVM